MVSTVPWSRVLDATPKIANAGRQLWDAIGKKKPAEVSTPLTNDIPNQIDEIKSDVMVLNAQLLAASELITQLADQNAQLVAQIEKINGRINYLIGIAIVFGLIAVLLFLTGGLK